MQIKRTYRATLFFGVLIASVVHGAAVSRVTSFSDGAVLFASQLNSEFNNLIGGINSINNDQIATNAAILPSKLSASIGGAGLARDGTSGVLSVSTDNVGIEVGSNQVRLKDAGTTDAKLANMPALSVKANATNSSAGPTNVAAASNGTVLKREANALVFDTIDTADITNGAVTRAKMAAVGQQLSSSYSGTITSSSFADIPTLSVTITTTGRPVMLMMVGGSAGSASGIEGRASGGDFSYLVRFRRGSTDVSGEMQTELNGPTGTTGSAVPCSAYMALDLPGAGTFTYTVSMRITGGLEAIISACRLVAYEL